MRMLIWCTGWLDMEQGMTGLSTTRHPLWLRPYGTAFAFLVQLPWSLKIQMPSVVFSVFMATKDFVECKAKLPRRTGRQLV